MKVIINKNDILNSLSGIQNITNKITNMKASNYVLIKAENSNIYILATDFKTSFEGVYNANVEKEGIVFIDSKNFFEIIKNFPTDEVIIESKGKDNKITEIYSDKINYKIVNISSDNFSSFPNISNTNFFLSIKSSALKKIIEKSTIIDFFDKDDDGKRKYLYGVSLNKTEDNLITLTSTDIKRFSIVKYYHKNKIENFSKKELLIDKKGLNEAGKFLRYEEEEVKIGVCEDKYFVIRKEKEIIVLNILEGIFPKYEYQKLLDEKRNIIINKNNFILALKRMSVFYSEKNKYLSFDFQDNKVFIKSMNKIIGESEEYLDIKSNNVNVKNNYNPRFFLEILSKIEEENIILNISESNNACFLMGEKDKNFISVFMPINIKKLK